MARFLPTIYGAAIAIISGHSVGREGPHVYLGAASGSLLGQKLMLPNNAIRTLVGCGAAAGIAASFNTPLAGVIFSLEVVMMEYTVSSFIPVILAAVSATFLVNPVFEPGPAFGVAIDMGTVADVPLVLLLGFAAGCVSALFNHLVERLAAWGRDIPFCWKTGLAGVMLGLFGVLVPEVMGIGYDTVKLALDGELPLGALLLILVMKILATGVAIGSGIAGGMIGPILFMGAMLGGIAGQLSGEWFSGSESGDDFYAPVSMGAMMGASLQAPLAALTAMDKLKTTGAEAVYVRQATVPGLKRVYGILTKGRIESAYQA